MGDFEKGSVERFADKSLQIRRELKKQLDRVFFGHPALDGTILVEKFLEGPVQGVQQRLELGQGDRLIAGFKRTQAAGGDPGLAGQVL